MPKPPKPTDAELDILRVLWTRGPSTVREVQESLNAHKPTLYTTALKMLQIMTDKGLVLRDASERSHVYRAKEAEEETQRRLVDDLLARAFSGSAGTLVMQALAGGKASEEELGRIRELLDRLEAREDGSSS